MIKSKYSLVGYSAEWPLQFKKYAKTIEECLGDNIMAIHHIGSTSVPGLAAKPIIDMLPLVQDISLVKSHHNGMLTAGFSYWDAYGLPGRQYFTKDRDGTRIVNCHIYQHDHPDALRHLAFPAYLRAHPDVCAAYEAIKREAILLHSAEINAYNDHKSDWIKKHEQLALDWYQH